MAVDHKASERRKVLDNLQMLAKRITEDMAAASMGIETIELWGGPQLADFGDDPEIAQARLTDTLAGIASAKAMFVALAQADEKGITHRQAILRIAAA